MPDPTGERRRVLDYGATPRRRRGAWFAHRPWVRAGLLRSLEVTVVITCAMLLMTFFPPRPRFSNGPPLPVTRTEWLVAAVFCAVSSVFSFAYAFAEHRWDKDRAAIVVALGVLLILAAGLYLLWRSAVAAA